MIQNSILILFNFLVQIPAKTRPYLNMHLKMHNGQAIMQIRRVQRSIIAVILFIPLKRKINQRVVRQAVVFGRH